MTRAIRSGVLAGLLAPALMASGLASAQEEPLLPRVKLAQDLSRAHAASAAGKEWLARNHAKAAQRMVPVLQRCVEDVEDGELMSFSTYLRLSQKGKVLEIVTELDPQLGRCMTDEAKGVQLPQAPREDFWFQVNLAAIL
jgi:hypothetical protein